jgi:hypothetical protein
MTQTALGPDLEDDLAVVAAKTGVQLIAERLLPTLLAVQRVFQAGKVITFGIEIRIDASSAASLTQAAAQLHEIAEAVEGAAATRPA